MFEKLQASEVEVIVAPLMVAPPRLYLLLCKIVSQVAINEKLFNIRPDEVKIERLCQFAGEEAFRTKGVFEANYSFNANILSLCVVHQMVDLVAAYMKKK